MNSYRFNSIIGSVARISISNELDIVPALIYRTIDRIDNQGRIITKDGKMYKLTLTEVTNEQCEKSM